MAAESVARKENTYTYTAIPHALMRKGLTSSACVLGGFINSYGSTKNGTARVASCTYARAKEELHIPQATFARGVKQLLSTGAVTKVKRSNYTFNSDNSAASGGFDVLPDWVRTDIFDIKTKQTDENGEHIHLSRRLTYSEMLVFSVIFTRLANEKNFKAKYAVSHAEIAAETKLSRRTVAAAVQILLGAGLFHQEKGGGRKKNTYTLNIKRYRALGGNRKRAGANRKGSSSVTVIHKLQSQVDAEKKAARERSRYADDLLRQLTAQEQEQNYRRAAKDKQFKAAEKEIAALSYQIAVAEVTSRAESEIEVLRARLEAANTARVAALRRLNIAETDLPPNRRQSNRTD